ncbi:MAG: nucleotidyltransferase domain-containing protein [Paludibaculum sp.]
MVLPEGTKVVTKPGGRVGVVVKTPADALRDYRVRFPEGREESFVRTDLAILKQVEDAIPDGANAADLYRYVVFRCIVGSTAYGLNHEGSDIDRRGFYLPPADLEWSLAGVPEQLESENEEVYWEIEKFVRLALKANPNVLECLYSPLVESCAPIAKELIEMRSIFLSQYVHRTYNSYVLSQFKKLEQDLRNHGQIRWKHVMHLIRLLLSGVVVLKEGFVPLRVDEYRDRLLAIRRGEVPWAEVEQWRLALHRELDSALTSTPLPEHPDYRQANEFLIRARRLATSGEYSA